MSATATATTGKTKDKVRQQPRKKSLRSMIRDAVDGTQEVVEVKQWASITEDGSPPKFVLTSMTGAQRAKFLRGATDEDGNVDFTKIYPQLVIACTHEPVWHEGEDEPRPGNPVFRAEDAEWLNDKNAAALETLARCAMRLSGMADDSEKEAGKGSSSDTKPSTES